MNMMPKTTTSGVSPRRSFLARRLLPGGQEPDPRFTLANERTFLAGIRTAMAFMAAGIALEAFSLVAASLPGAAPGGETMRTASAAVLIGIGIVIAGGAFYHWWAVERALRDRRPLPVNSLTPLLTLVVIAVSAALLMYLLAGGAGG